MRSFLTVILSSLVLLTLVYAGYYAYMFDKKDTVHTTGKKSSEPYYLTKDFWINITPENFDNKLSAVTNVNTVRPNDNKSMLHLLVEYGSYPEMVKKLIEMGVNYNLRAEEVIGGGALQLTALVYAILRNKQALEFTKALLEYTDVNSPIIMNYGITPLILACYWRRPVNLIKLLLEKGADPKAKTLRTGNHSLIAASAANVFSGSKYINPEVIQLLLDYKADIREKNAEGKDAFDYMKQNEEFKKTELFKKLSTQLNQPK